MSYKLGFYIPINVVGLGLYIPHFGGIVFNLNTLEIKSILLSDMVVGHLKGTTPTIGDNFFIGSGVKIFGDVFMDDNFWIDANTVVTKDVKETNAVVVGNAAKTIGCKEKYWNNTIAKY